MSEGSRKTALVIGAVAAAAGIAVVSGIFIRRRYRANSAEPDSMHSISEVLSDCYTKMREIQDQLSRLSIPAVRRPAGQT